MEGEDFTICSWFVCSLSRHEAVCAVVVLTIVMNSGNTGCCDMGGQGRTAVLVISTSQHVSSWYVWGYQAA